MRYSTLKSRKSAFTLIELLVVISIILIASSIIFIGGNGGDGAKLSSGQRVVSGIAQGARGQAILKGARTRLIIYADESDTRDVEKYLRYFGIIYEDNDNPGSWIAATQGTYLPEGIYFDADASEENGSKWRKSNFEKFEYPLAVAKPEGSGEDYYYYEFNSNGTMATDFDNGWLVIRANTLKPDVGGNLGIDFDNIEESKRFLAAALIFRRVGTTTPVSNTDEIVK
ncbi:MAG: prepilin-type N-terminal cleavage/methylation domain-containing protein [Opitutales bacterium]|nr:prepilin-type N-terminal cleavage/methylation domain-containing protein [Opitutales bacterium]